jgi:hypothetical protein
VAFTQTYGFGSGVMWGSIAGAPNVPIRFGILQDVSVDFTFTTKELFGSYQFPVAIGRGTAKITGTANYGAIDKGTFAQLFFNDTPAANQDVDVDQEAGTIPTTPFAVTTVHSAAWTTDLDVTYALTGQPLTPVASGPITGQYSVAAGVYTFAAADTGLGVLISYKYAGTTGFKTTLSNRLLGDAPTFAVDFYQRSNLDSTQQWGLRLNKCLSSKLTLATKLEDFMMPKFDFEAYADSANVLGTLNTPF